MTPFSKWKTIGYALAIFITGGISGGALGVYETKSHLFTPVRDQELALRLRKRLENRLALTPEQIAKVDPIIDSSVRDIRSIRMESAQRVVKVLDDSYAQISAVLTPDQRTKLDEMQRERHEMMQGQGGRGMEGRWHNGQGGPGGGPGRPGGPPRDGMHRPENRPGTP